jgi:hypothetical protein
MSREGPIKTDVKGMGELRREINKSMKGCTTRKENLRRIFKEIVLVLHIMYSVIVGTKHLVYSMPACGLTSKQPLLQSSAQQFISLLNKTIAKIYIQVL